MKILNAGNVIRLALDEIIVGPRLRRVSQVQLANLLTMAEDTGITTPIHVRKVGAGYELIDGAHRLAAARTLGLPDIACLVVECRQDEARAMEASNNLGAARMSPVQTVIFAASWKRDFYAMHPERKKGVFKGNRYQQNLVSAENALTTALADSFGLKPRQIFNILSVGEKLTPEEAELLDGAEAKASLQDLATIGKISEPKERAAIVRDVAAGKKATVARAAWKARQSGVEAPVKDPVEEAFAALKTLWSRAPEAAKRRFVEETEQQLSLRLIAVREARGGIGK